MPRISISAVCSDVSGSSSSLLLDAPKPLVSLSKLLRIVVTHLVTLGGQVGLADSASDGQRAVVTQRQTTLTHSDTPLSREDQMIPVRTHTAPSMIATRMRRFEAMSGCLFYVVCKICTKYSKEHLRGRCHVC